MVHISTIYKTGGNLVFRKLLTSKSNNDKFGFTIVELLVVIVIIGILSTITIVSYIGVTQKATEASLKAELTVSASKMDIYHAQNGSYPYSFDTNNCPNSPESDSNNCLKFNSGTTFKYDSIGSNNYNLTATKNNISYRTRPGSAPVIASSPTCPTNYVSVPGSNVYGTNDFCVMKYEAKISGNDNGDQVYASAFSPDSRSTGTPWVNVSQVEAISEAQTACTGCHLMTEAERMTLIQNVLSVPGNWSGNAVGSGYIYSGHSDAAPNNAIDAGAGNDTYANTGDNAEDDGVTNDMIGKSQKRTLTLTNSEVIWDISGNVWEVTSDQTTNGVASQPGVTANTYSAWIDYSMLDIKGSLATNITPTGTKINGANDWTSSSNGIGKLISNPYDTSVKVGLKGADYNDRSNAGVLASWFDHSPNSRSQNVGFRVTK